MNVNDDIIFEIIKQIFYIEPFGYNIKYIIQLNITSKQFYRVLSNTAICHFIKNNLEFYSDSKLDTTDLNKELMTINFLKDFKRMSKIARYIYKPTKYQDNMVAINIFNQLLLGFTKKDDRAIDKIYLYSLGDLIRYTKDRLSNSVTVNYLNKIILNTQELYKLQKIFGEHFGNFHIKTLVISPEYYNLVLFVTTNNDLIELVLPQDNYKNGRGLQLINIPKEAVKNSKSIYLGKSFGYILLDDYEVWFWTSDLWSTHSDYNYKPHLISVEKKIRSINCGYQDIILDLEDGTQYRHPLKKKPVIKKNKRSYVKWE